MKLYSLLISFITISSCHQNDIQTIELNSPPIEFYIEKFANARETNLVLMIVNNHSDSTELLLYDLYTTCIMYVGDEFGYLVNPNKWKNITAPIYKTRIKSIDVYIESGMERIYKSTDRYTALLSELKGRIDICVERFNKDNDEFWVNPPKSSLQMPWKMIINSNGTQMTTMTSRREGHDDFYYETEIIRIDTNYMEKYD